MLQNAIVVAIIVVAAIYLLRRFRKNSTSGGCGCGCEGCGLAPKDHACSCGTGKMHTGLDDLRDPKD